MPFPSIKAKSLTNESIRVPNKSNQQLLILGFDMKSSEPMEAWVRALNLTSKRNISWLQMPVIGGVPPFVDGFIKKGMKKSIPTPIQAQFVPYFGKKKADIIRAITNQENLSDVVTPFIIIIDDAGSIQFSLQALVTTKNIAKVNTAIKNHMP